MPLPARCLGELPRRIALLPLFCFQSCDGEERSAGEPELERVLDEMTRSGFIYHRRIDRTERVIRKLLEGRQKPSSPCRRCGSARVVGLYAAFRGRTPTQSKVKVGSYSLMCNVHSIDKGRLLGENADSCPSQTLLGPNAHIYQDSTRQSHNRRSISLARFEGSKYASLDNST